MQNKHPLVSKAILRKIRIKKGEFPYAVVAKMCNCSIREVGRLFDTQIKELTLRELLFLSEGLNLNPFSILILEDEEYLNEELLAYIKAYDRQKKKTDPLAYLKSYIPFWERRQQMLVQKKLEQKKLRRRKKVATVEE